jgi:hypothetical protein
VADKAKTRRDANFYADLVKFWALLQLLAGAIAAVYLCFRGDILNFAMGVSTFIGTTGASLVLLMASSYVLWRTSEDPPE